MSDWESISTPRGALFYGWSQQEGQSVTGRVVHVGTGSKPNNAGPCPELTLELTEDTFSMRKGERVNVEAGTTVTVTAAQYQLERDIKAAELAPGDFLKITLQGVQRTRSGNTVKDFDVKIKRGAAPASPSTPAYTGGLQAESPF